MPERDRPPVAARPPTKARGNFCRISGFHALRPGTGRAPSEHLKCASRPATLVSRENDMTIVTDNISPDSPMSAVLESFPGAQRALFRRYHIGGCSSCGFRPDETLAQ